MEVDWIEGFGVEEGNIVGVVGICKIFGFLRE